MGFSVFFDFLFVGVNNDIVLYFFRLFLNVLLLKFGAGWILGLIE